MRKHVRATQSLEIKHLWFDCFNFSVISSCFHKNPHHGKCLINQSGRRDASEFSRYLGMAPTCLLARQVGLQPVAIPVRSPQSNDMAECLVKTIKRDYLAHMPKPDRETALRNLAIAFEYCNEQHPHSALKYRSPREFRRLAAALILTGSWCPVL